MARGRTEGPAPGISIPLLWSLVALLLRSIPSWSNVFTSGNVLTSDGLRFQLVDSWVHLRSIEHLALHFPHRLQHDPLAFFPGGAEVPWPPLFDAVVGALAWLLADGVPMSPGVEVIAALASPIFGAATVFVVYRLAFRLFDGKTAALAAVLLAVLPGPFFVFSSLGFADHHAFEILLATLLLAAVLEALDTGRPWKAGLTLGLYLLAWNGAALLVALLAVWAAFLIALRSDRAAARVLARTVLSMFALAAVAVLLFWSALPQAVLDLASLAGGSLLLVVALWVGRVPSRGLKAGALALLGSAALGGVWWLAPRIWSESLGRLVPSGAELSVSEMRPLLLGLDGRFSLLPAWTVLGPIFFLFLAAWAAFAVEVYRRPTADRSLLLAWSGALLALTLLQFRFAASLGPSCAILVAWGAVCFVGAVEASAAAGGLRRTGRSAVAWAVVLLLAVYPSALMAYRQGAQDRGPGDGWWEALTWLREETPSPGDPAQYGVLAWWDYGSLITYQARRAPMANGSGLGIRLVAEILTETDLARAEEKIAASGGRYVLVDDELILRMTRTSPRTLEGKILGALQWAGRPREDFVEVVDLLQEGGGTVATPVYFPRYFQTLAARLVLFGGQAVDPDVISVVRLASRDPGPSAGRRLLLRQVTFRRIDEARRFLEERRAAGETGWEIVSLSPFHSPIPLEAVSKLRSVYPPDAPAGGIPAVRIFEVITADFPRDEGNSTVFPSREM